MPNKGYIQTDEHRKAISQGMRKAYSRLTDEEKQARLEKRRYKAEIKNFLYKQFIEKTQKAK